MPKRKTPELDPKEQFKRFQEAAKEHGVSEKRADEVAKSFQTIAGKSQSQKTVKN